MSLLYAENAAEVKKIKALPENLSPRLYRLLAILLNEPEPLKVDTLAEMLGTSRRTVFRELENAEKTLSPAAELLSVPGKGITLSAGPSARQDLLAALEEHSSLPGNRRERLLRLLAELLSNGGVIQKMFYYADTLGVSESTVSNDLDELEEWLSGYGVSLVRKSGLGVFAEGEEIAVRMALVNRFIRDGITLGRSYSAAFGYPGENIERTVREALRRREEDLDWMTAESQGMIALYLMVMAERFIRNREIGESGRKAPGAFQIRLAESLAAEMDRGLHISLPPFEVRELAAQIGACRAKQNNPVQIMEREELIEGLAFQMIERFDPAVAPILKTNEVLIRMLKQHLGPALTRLEERLELPDPLKGNLALQYPEVYQKTRRAVSVLEKYFSLPVPASEISFIAIHFLGALSVLGEKDIRRRVLRAGIICVAGIGMSYLLASQIRGKFKGDLEIEIAEWADKSSWEKADFLISTIPVENAGIPLVLVNTLLDREDYQKIQNAVNTYAFVAKDVPAGKRPPLKKRIEDTAELLRQTGILLDSFAVKYIKPDCSFEELIRFAAEQFADSSETLCRALAEREKLGSQIIPGLKIVLLHIRSAAAAFPVFALILPRGGEFLDRRFNHVKSCVVMLLPRDCDPEMSSVMGRISSSLIDTPAFLEAVLTGNGPVIKSILESELSDALVQYCGKKLKD